MIKGLFIALIVLVVGDFALNEGQFTHHVRAAIVGLASASSESVNDSVFRK